LRVIGLGGSAGSIPALQTFLENIAAQTGSAYVVVLHLSPEHESHLAEILGRSTRLPVHQVNESVRLAADQVYVIPPGKHLEMRDGTLAVGDLDRAAGRRTVVDTFFRTLAVAHGPQAGAIVFSGAGSDGTLGIRHIKEHGGLVVVQAPNEAEYDTMPRSAIATGMADYVLPVAAMPAQIATYWETSRRMRMPQEAAPSPEQREEGPEQEVVFHEILTHIRIQTGHDFALYKRATVLRRIGRRMQVNGLESLSAYRNFLRSHPAETGDLVSDLLISVTQFFRDPVAWEALEHDLIPRLFQGKAPTDEVRVWVCASATGEEAYSLAMLLLERAEKMAQPPRIQIFATDMDANAIANARVGVYPDTIVGDVSEERLRRWFYRQNGTYQIRKEVREAVVFAHHDVLRDTPFSRLDLVTCRNLLIYLNRAAQERVFHTFHFALRPDGRLFLGSSESADASNGLFGVTDKAQGLYIRRPSGRSVVPPLPATTVFTAATAGIAGTVLGRTNRMDASADLGAGASPPPPTRPTLPSLSTPQGSGSSGGNSGGLFQKVLERFGPPTALVNEYYDIVHLSGKVSRFLSLSAGEPTFNLLQLIHPTLRLELRAALFAATTEGGDQVRLIRAAMPVTSARTPATEATEGGTGGQTEEDALPLAIRLTVRPVTAPPVEDTQRYFLVLFEELPVLLHPEPATPRDNAETNPPARESGEAASVPAAPATAEAAFASAQAAAEVAYRLDQENATLQRQLRARAEHYDAQAEELKSANEELLATNEEMRSVTEELETGKEELQSVNEELSTVNQELKARVEELTSTNSDLSNFLSSTDIGTIFLDRSLRIKRFTPAAEALFNLIATDAGRPLTHLTSRLDYPNLTDDAQTVLSRLIQMEREISTHDGDRYFLARLVPYRSLEDRIEGIVLNFIDITQRKRAEEALRVSEARMRTLADAVPQVIWTNTADGMADYFNQRWYEYTGLSYEESAGPGWQAIVHPDDAPASVERWQHALRAGAVFDTEYRLRRHDGAYRWFIGRNVPMKDEAGRVTGWFGTATDIDDLKQAQAARQESEERFRLLVEGAKDYAMFLISPDNRVTFWSAGAERLFGWTEQEALGQDGAFIFTPEDREERAPEKERQTALTTGRAVDRRWHLRKDGSRFWADGILMRLEDESGNLRGFAKVTRDATEQKQAEEAIQASLEAVAQANEQLEQRVQERTLALSQRTQELSDALIALEGTHVVRRELLRRLVNAQEMERGHIARELHDNTGQLVTGLSLGLNNLASILPSLPDEAREMLAGMRRIADELGAEAHRLSANLRPTALDQFGLVVALQNYGEQWSAWGGIPVDFQVLGLEGAGERLPYEIESTVYRIVQEALTNVLRHARPNQHNQHKTANRSKSAKRGVVANDAASRVSVLLQRTDTHLIATVEDDGPGFDVRAAMSLPPDQRRLGLFGMRERAELVGGTLDIESTLGKGTTIFLRVPLEQPEKLPLA
jgi:two-component system CheB/CheR fusion protein